MDLLIEKQQKLRRDLEERLGENVYITFLPDLDEDKPKGLQEEVEGKPKGMQEEVKGKPKGLQEEVEDKLKGLQEEVEDKPKGLQEEVEDKLKGLQEEVEDKPNCLQEEVEDKLKGVQEEVEDKPKGMQEEVEDKPKGMQGEVEDKQEEADFKVGPFDCLRGGVETCFMGTFCGWSLNYLTAGKIGKKYPTGMGLLGLLFPGLGATFTRMNVREHYGMEDEPFMDVVCGTCCTPCTNCQTYNEVKERGL